MPVYFDYNATTPLAAEALAAMQPHLTRPFGNPASVHRYGRAALAGVERGRQQVAALVNCRVDELIFTSGGTESNNLALKGIAARQPGRAVLYGGTEHPSVLEAATALVEAGTVVDVIPMNAEGEVDWRWLEARLARGDVALVSLMRANNETGVVQDIARAASLAHAQGALLHVDAVQAAGKIPVDFTALDCDLLSLSAHKLYGPRGIGALVLRAGVDLAPQLHGGGHEAGLRSGTLNTPGIVGFGAAAALAAERLADFDAHCSALRQRLEAGLLGIDGVVIFGRRQPRVANTTQFAVPGFDGEAMVMALDREGYAVSSGSACQAGHGQPSHVLLAMGIEPDLAKAAVRVSLGRDSSVEEVDGFLAALGRILGRDMAALP